MEKEMYDEVFYNRVKKEKNLDYNYYGDWQRSYAKMVISIIDIIREVSDNRTSLLVDIGCACGVQLRGFKETKVFGDVLGVDISEYMTNLGKQTHGFTDEEMLVVDITKEGIPIKDNSATMVHCTQVLEHLDEKEIKIVLKEIHRILKPKTGYCFIILPAIKTGTSAKTVKGFDVSHVTVKTLSWWKMLFAKTFKLDKELHKKFQASKFSPIYESKDSFYHFYKKEWTIFGFRKEK